jgi:hypothetical protein
MWISRAEDRSSLSAPVSRRAGIPYGVGSRRLRGLMRAAPWERQTHRTTADLRLRSGAHVCRQGIVRWFLLHPAGQRLFPTPEIDMGGSHIADSNVIALIQLRGSKAGA